MIAIRREPPSADPTSSGGNWPVDSQSLKNRRSESTLGTAANGCAHRRAIGLLVMGLGSCPNPPEGSRTHHLHQEAA